MALQRIDFKMQDNSLQPCWIVGQNNFKRSQISKLLHRQQIENFDIAATCNEIFHLIKSPSSDNNAVAFKDIARLTLGVTKIYNERLSILMDDTERLLDEIKGTRFNAMPATHKSSITVVRRKRKSVVTKKTTTMTLSKRPRTEEFLIEKNNKFYRELLDESELLHSCDGDDIVEETIELPRLGNEMSQNIRNITIETYTEEIIENLDLNGFGESDSEAPDLSYFLDLFPRSFPTIPSKRKSTEVSSMGDLVNKIPKLSVNESELDVTAGPTCPINFNLDIKMEIGHNVAVPSPIPEQFVQFLDPLKTNIFDPDIKMEIARNDINASHLPESLQEPGPLRDVLRTIKNKRQRKTKSKLGCIDERKKLTRKTFFENQMQYIAMLNQQDPVISIVKPKLKAKDLLSNFKNNRFFPGVAKLRPKLSIEKQNQHNIETLRVIFGIEYTDEMANGILGKSSHAVVEPMSAVDDILTTTHMLDNLPVDSTDFNNNNNEIDKTIPTTEIPEKFSCSTFTVMSDLLHKWHNQPNSDEIDVKKFLKSYPSRTAAALVFRHLLGRR